MPLADFHISHPAASGHIRVQVDKFTAVEFAPDEQRQLLDELARNFGMVLASPRVVDRLTRPYPGHAVERVTRYLLGRKSMTGLDPEEIHGIAPKGAPELIKLLASDLQALLDYVKEA